MLVPDASPEVDDVSDAELPELLPLEAALDVDEPELAAMLVSGDGPPENEDDASPLRPHADATIAAKVQVAVRRRFMSAQGYLAPLASATPAGLGRVSTRGPARPGCARRVGGRSGGRTCEPC